MALAPGATYPWSMGVSASEGRRVGEEGKSPRQAAVERALRLLPTPAEPEADLRTLADRARAGAKEVHLAWLWQELTSGASICVDAYCCEERCFAILREGPRVEAGPQILNARNLEFLRRVLLGTQQKVVAIEYGVSDSLLAGVIGQCARAMGFDCCATRIPTLMLMAARADATGEPTLVGELAMFTAGGKTYRVVNAARPSPAPSLPLSPAERAVVALLVDRRTNADIAEVRRTSARTVANQLSSVMRKLGACGRSEILSRLIDNCSTPAGRAVVGD